MTLCSCSIPQDLIKDLQGELSGDFENVIIGLCQSNADFDADQLRKAMKVNHLHPPPLRSEISSIAGGHEY